jgi:lipoate-protein ligase A
MDAVANLDELKLELKRELRQEILTEVLDIIRDEFYPPEEKIRKEFIKKVEEAERRVKEGKFLKYTPEEFEKKFL